MSSKVSSNFPHTHAHTPRTHKHSYTRFHSATLLQITPWHAHSIPVLSRSLQAWLRTSWPTTAKLADVVVARSCRAARQAAADDAFHGRQTLRRRSDERRRRRPSTPARLMTEFGDDELKNTTRLAARRTNSAARQSTQASADQCTY